MGRIIRRVKRSWEGWTLRRKTLVMTALGFASGFASGFACWVGLMQGEGAHVAARFRALANPWLWGAIVCGSLLVSSFVLLVAYRKKVAERVWPARFFAASVLINTVFVLLLFLWKLPGVVDAIVMHFEEHLPSNRIKDEDVIGVQEQQETVYSQLEDLPALESAKTDWPTEPIAVLPADRPMNVPALPIDNTLPLSESLPAHVPQTVVALRPAFPSPAPILKPLTRSLPTPEILIHEETPPGLPKSDLELLEKLPNQTTLAKTDAVSTQGLPPLLPMDSQASVSPSRRVPVPLSLPTGLPPASVAVTANLARQFPAPSDLKQIAEQEASTKLTAQQGEKEQNLPVDDPTVDRQAAMIPSGVKLPDAANGPLPLLQKEAIVFQPAKTFPAVSDRTMANLRVERRNLLPDRLAMVAELNQAPTLAVPKPAGQQAPNPEVAKESESQSPAQRNLAETVSPPPEVNVAETAPNVLTKPAGVLNSPRHVPPQLSRMSLKPTASVVDLAQPVEVHETVELSALLSLRNPETRQEMAQTLGLAPAQEAAVKRGLLWLANHQNDDGSWSLHDFHQNCKKHGGECSGVGSERSNTAATGLALLPFLAAGHVPGSKEYGPVVAKGLDWLFANQHEDGKVQGAGDGQVMYSHGIAAIALCEAYAMTQDPRLGEAATKAVDFIVKSQHQPSGGWRYNPNEPGDTSVVGWQVMALKSAEMAGIAVPKTAYDNVHRWLASVEGDKPIGGVFGYVNQQPSPAMTAEGLLCLEFLEEPRTSPRLQHGTEYLLKYLPEKDQRDTSYSWYYATQVLYHLQGEPWETWNKPLKELLLDTQDKEGHTSGTWAPKDQWEQRGGRIYATSIKLLMLEIDYRHLPLYGSVKPIVKP